MGIVSLGVVVGVLVTSLAGCTGPPDYAGPPDGIRQIGVAKLDAPPTIAPGSSLDVVLTVELGGCISFDHISAFRNASQITLSAWGKEFMPPPNGACIDILIEEPHTYRLEPPFPPRFTILVQPIQSGPLLTQEVQVQ